MELTTTTGYGYGYGSGCGYGSGSGYGSSYGSGSGSGSGSGYGYGSGSGSGSGSGKQAEEYYAAILTVHSVENAEVVFWRSRPDGTPANGGDGVPVKEGETEELPGSLPANCGRGAFHGTRNPAKWHGERWWLVALHHPVKEGDDKLWSLKRTILKDLGKCPF